MIRVVSILANVRDFVRADVSSVRVCEPVFERGTPARITIDACSTTIWYLVRSLYTVLIFMTHLKLIFPQIMM